MVIQFLIFCVATILFYTVATLFYFPTSNAQEFLFFHILANNCYFLGVFLAVAILVGVRYYLTVILTCISLINNDGEHFFHMLVGHLYIFLGEMSSQIHCPL